MVLFYIFLMLISSGSCQEPNISLLRIYEVDSSIDIEVRQSIQNDGKIYIGGALWDAKNKGISEIFLIQADKTGNPIWAKNYGSPASSDACYSIVPALDGGCIVGGTTFAFEIGNYDAYFLKVDSRGDTLWTRTWGEGKCGEAIKDIKQTPDGAYIATGMQWTPEDKIDILAIKLDGQGNVIWTKKYDVKDNDIGYVICQANDNGFVIVGTTRQGDSPPDVLFLKIDNQGNLIWQKVYGGENADHGFNVIRADNGYLVVGRTQSFGAQWADVYVIKTDNQGNILWQNTYGESGAERANTVYATPQGYLIAGESFSQITSHAYFLGIDKDGNLLWQKKWGKMNYNEACAIIPLGEDFLIAGNTVGKRVSMFLLELKWSTSEKSK